MERQWFVGMTKDQQETRAAAELRNQGFEVYLPKVFVRHQDGKKIEARAHLRFTGYLFVSCLPIDAEFSPISNTRGMDDSDGSPLLGRPHPVAVPAFAIEQLRSIEDVEYARAVARKKPLPRTDLTPGDLVRIIGDSDHAAYGRQGHLLGAEKGIASVLCGMMVFKVAEIDLKKIEQKAAA